MLSQYLHARKSSYDKMTNNRAIVTLGQNYNTKKPCKLKENIATNAILTNLMT